MLIEPLKLTTPIAGFNGGLFVRPDLSIIDAKTLPADVSPQAVKTILAGGLDVWIYRGNDWFVTDRHGPHVDREEWTVKFPPNVVPNFDGLLDNVSKIVGVSDDLEAVAQCETAARAEFGRPCVCRAFSALLSGRDAPAGEQRFCRTPLIAGDEYPNGTNRHDRRHAQRCADVRPERIEHRDGQCHCRSPASRPPRYRD